MTENLKACPFCNFIPEPLLLSNSLWEVHCGECPVSPTAYGKSREDVVSIWNTRPTIEGLVDTLAEDANFWMHKWQDEVNTHAEVMRDNARLRGEIAALSQVSPIAVEKVAVPQEVIDCLEKIARLGGTGGEYGNSEGNMIARQALLFLNGGIRQPDKTGGGCTGCSCKDRELFCLECARATPDKTEITYKEKYETCMRMLWDEDHRMETLRGVRDALSKISFGTVVYPADAQRLVAELNTILGEG
jgi:hypothetical protein